jgi:hypothetical protein
VLEAKVGSHPFPLQILARRRRSAFAMTETELKLMAAAAIMGLRRMPVRG